MNHLAKFKMTIAYLNEKDILIEVPLDKDKYFFMTLYLQQRG